MSYDRMERPQSTALLKERNNDMHVKSDSDNLLKGQMSNLYDAGSGTQLNDPDRSNQSSFFQLR